MSTIDYSVIRRNDGKNIYYLDDDERGKQLAVSGGILNPRTNRLWDLALLACDWDLVVDVGANYGEMLLSEKLAVDPRPSIFAFEPNKKITPALRRTIRDANIDVILREVALSDYPSPNKAFRRNDRWSGMSSLSDKSSENTQSSEDIDALVSVPCSTIDIELRDIAYSSVLLKLDVEGHELKVLEGARNALTAATNYGVLVEILHMSDRDISSLFSLGMVYALDSYSDSLITLKPPSVCDLHGQLSRPGVYTQDLLILFTGSTQQDQKQRTHCYSSPRERIDDQNAREATKSRLAVYTAVIGNYEVLGEDHDTLGKEEADYICFTDNPSLQSSLWDIRLIEPRFPTDLIRSARFLKLLPHLVLPEYDKTLWIDNCVQLIRSPVSFVEQWLTADYDIALAYHSYRRSVAAEFDKVEELGLDSYPRILDQYRLYEKYYPWILQEPVCWTGIIARRNVPAVNNVMERWYEQVLRFTRRDQLSVNLALRELYGRVHYLKLDNHLTDLHRWPQPRSRNTSYRRLGYLNAHPSVFTQLGRQQNINDQLSSEIRSLKQQLMALRSSQRSSLVRRISSRAKRLISWNN